MFEALQRHPLLVFKQAAHEPLDMRAALQDNLHSRLCPVNVVETRVAHGMTSRFILEVLETIDAGRSWSIDLPPLNPITRQEVRVAVRQTGAPVDRRTYIADTSRRRLPVQLSCHRGRRHRRQSRPPYVHQGPCRTSVVRLHG